MDDEYFCDNINRTLPSSLAQSHDPINPNISINPTQPEAPYHSTYPTPLPTNTVTSTGMPIIGTTSVSDLELAANTTDSATTSSARESISFVGRYSFAVLAVLLIVV